MRDEIALPTAFTLRLLELFEPGPVSTASWCVSWQAHQGVNDAGRPAPPPIRWQLIPGDYRELWLRHDVGGKLVEHAVWRSPEPIVRGRRYEWHFDVLLSLDLAKGGVRLRDGQGTLVAARQPVGYRNQRTAYMAEGLYRAPTPETIAKRLSGIAVDAFAGF